MTDVMNTIVVIFLICHNNFSFGNRVAMEDTSPEYMMNMVNMMSVFNKHVVIVHDDRNVEFASGMSTLFDGQKLMMFSYHQVHTVLVPVVENLMKHASLEQMLDQLHFLVVCELTCVKQLFTEIGNLDLEIGQGSLLRHFSTWMFISSDGPPPTNTTLDNVVWMRVYETIHITSSVDIRYFKEPPLQITETYTLLWMPGNREWSKVNQCDLNPSSLYKHLFPNKERGLNGRTIVLSTLEWTTYAIREVVEGKVHYKGAGFDIVDNLKMKFNFSYITVEPEDKLWGQDREDGTFTGVLGVLQRKEADLCPVPYSHTLSRSSAIDLSSTIKENEFSLMYKKTPDEALSWLFFASRFSWPIYLCGAGSLLWVVLVLFLLQYWSRMKAVTMDEATRLFQHISLHIPFRQDIQVLPRSMSSRVMTFSWSLFCLMFAAVYMGNLVAVRTVDINKPPFNSLEELAHQTDYKIVILEGVHVTSYLKTSSDSVLKTIYQRLTVLPTSENKSFDETENRFIQKVLSGKYVALMTKTMMRDLMSKSCELEGIQKRFFPRSTGLAFPKHSPLNKYFDNQLLYMLETGLIETFIKEWSPREIHCYSDSQLPKFTVDHFKICLIVVVAGIISSGVALLFENLVKRAIQAPVVPMSNASTGLISFSTLLLIQKQRE